jgi:hypothetical protein
MSSDELRILKEVIKMAAVPELRELRQILLENGLKHYQETGMFRREERGFLNAERVELMWAALAAYEFADGDGPFAKDERARDAVKATLEGVSEEFELPTGAVGPYFTLVPLTRALVSLKPYVEAPWHSRLVERSEWLFAQAVANVYRPHDYLNPRGLEVVSCLGLHHLAGDKQYLDRLHECLDQLIIHHYPCGAQPYHTGNWVWGRRPAQVYQFLTGSMMLQAALELGRQDVIETVRRLADYALMSTNRRGEALVTPFETLRKSKSLACAGRQWAIATALGDQRFQGLARTTYENWALAALELSASARNHRLLEKIGPFYLEALTEALHMGVREIPKGDHFVPSPGRHILPDISTVFVHEPELDIAMTVLTGHSAFAEADCGNVKLFAVTPELTQEPTSAHAGTDALRADFRLPSEQLECTEKNGRIVLSGRVFIKLDARSRPKLKRDYLRQFEVTLTYENSEMVLEYETKRAAHNEPVPARLLFLLIGRPTSESPHLMIGNEVDINPPPADSGERFFAQAKVAEVRFFAPDGSGIEVVPELSLADSITAERTEAGWFRPSEKGRQKPVKSDLKPANEGSLRLAFEGPKVLDRGRYRIRFRR